MSSCPKMADPLKRYIIFYFVSPLYHNTSYLETGFIFRSILFAPWKGWFVKLVFIMFLISFIPEFISFLLDLHFMDKVYVQIKSCTSGNNLQMLLKTSECKMLFYVIYYGPLPSTFRICDIFTYKSSYLQIETFTGCLSFYRRRDQQICGRKKCTDTLNLQLKINRNISQCRMNYCRIIIF